MDGGKAMTPEFWQYLITHCSGSTIRFVAEQDRHDAEKELEGDPQLLSYQAKPQMQCPVQCRPESRVLRHLRQARHRLEANHIHDSVVTINDRHWPAYRKQNGTLVDLRLFDPNDHSQKPRLLFRPDALREAGIPDALIEVAALSDPQGLVLFEDAPQFKGCDGPFQ
jgi:hypothetical protein